MKRKRYRLAPTMLGGARASFGVSFLPKCNVSKINSASARVLFYWRKRMESIIVAIITGALSLLGVIITNMNSNRKIERQLEVSMAITNTKLEDLTKQVEKHNQVIERTYKLEQAVADIQRRG